MAVTPPSAAAPLTIDAKASWLICEKICVPEEGRLRLDLSSGDAAPSSETRLFASADQRIPRPSPYVAELLPDATLVLTGAGISSRSVKEASFFPDKWGAIEDAAPQRLAVEDERLSLALEPAQNFDPKLPLSGVLRIADADGAKRFLSIAAAPKEMRLAPRPAQLAETIAFAEARTTPDIGILTMLLFAFLGGLILNLMPCVFPILAIKAVSIAKLSARSPFSMI